WLRRWYQRHVAEHALGLANRSGPIGPEPLHEYGHLSFLGAPNARATGSLDHHRGPPGIATPAQLSRFDHVAAAGDRRRRSALRGVLRWQHANEHARSGANAANRSRPVNFRRDWIANVKGAADRPPPSRSQCDI